MAFMLPDSCPVENKLGCSFLEGISSENEVPVEDNVDIGSDNECTTPVDKCITQDCSSAISEIKHKYGCTEALVETEVRRSNRLKNYSKGFKQSSCQQKNCLGCSAEAPTLSPSVIKNLGTEFCNLSPEKVNDEALKKRKKAKAPVGQKAPKEGKEKQDEMKKGKKLKVSTKKLKKKPTNEDQDKEEKQNGTLPGQQKKGSFWWRNITKLTELYKGIAAVT
ncbi:hypothetical protein EJB05_04859, partial [Eragrostis curvula]